MPKLCVIIPCFNYGFYLKQCVNSVLDQSFRDFEILILDDASTDNTSQVGQSFHDRRVRYIRNSANLGHVENFNKGIAMSNSQYICIIGADDMMLQSNLQQKIDILDKYPSVGLVYSRAFIIDLHDKIVGHTFQVGQSSTNYIGGRNDFCNLLLYNNYVIASSVVFSRECVQRLGCFRKFRYGEDWDLWLRIAKYYDFAFLQAPLVGYRVHSSGLSKTAKTTGIAEEEIFKILAIHTQELNQRIKRQIIANNWVIIARGYLKEGLWDKAFLCLKKGIRDSASILFHWGLYKELAMSLEHKLKMTYR